VDADACAIARSKDNRTTQALGEKELFIFIIAAFNVKLETEKSHSHFVE
jgi:hypothetical protein